MTRAGVTGTTARRIAMYVRTEQRTGRKTMAEYIDRQAATAYAPLPRELREYQTANLDDAFEYGYDFAIGQIDAIPAADVRPVVRGKWKEDWETGCSECSACGESYLWEDYDGVGEWNFCPNCGAKMEG